MVFCFSILPKPSDLMSDTEKPAAIGTAFQLNAMESQVRERTDSIGAARTVFTFLEGEGWLFPPEFIDLTVIRYKVAGFSPVTVPGEFFTIVSMKESPSSAVSM